MNRDITWDRVRELFDYRDDGNLIWKKSPSKNVKAGNVAGNVGYQGYRNIKIDGTSYKAHRIIFLWHHGKHPEHIVDHADGDVSNNRIENLRDVSQKRNLENAKVSVRNTSGIKGVSISTGNGKWVAHIRIDGKQTSLGFYETLSEAAFARLMAELKIDYAGRVKESSALNYLEAERGGYQLAKDVYRAAKTLTTNPYVF